MELRLESASEPNGNDASGESTALAGHFPPHPCEPERGKFLFATRAGSSAPLERHGSSVLPVPQAIETPNGLQERTIRLLDIIAAGSLLVIFSPAMLLCVLLVLASGPGPALFRHIRIGKDGREFECFKFRTMLHDAEAMIAPLLADSDDLSKEWASSQKLFQDPRVTKFGRFMRRYSFDELPQLFNVLAGDMSMVGPRPIVRNEIPRYGEHFHDYCSVKPGLTGLWQVSGRNDVTYETRVRLDAAYARSRSLKGNLIILLRTVPVVLTGRGY